MSKYKIGITEAGDAGIDLSWEDKLSTVDGAVLVTKNVTDAFIDAVMRNADKLIVHATVTGYGGTVVEPNVPKPQHQFDGVMELVRQGFPKERITIRVDPIIPTEKGMNRAVQVMKTFMNEGFGRYRVSLIDMYRHVKERFTQAGLPLPYGNSVSPLQKDAVFANCSLLIAKKYWAGLGHDYKSVRIEACAEPKLTEAIQCGCISEYDLNLLGLDGEEADNTGYQRPGCMCYSGKKELLKHKQRCPHGCVYCYWQD